MSLKWESLKALVMNNNRMIDVMLYALADHANALIRSLPGCHFCETAATVTHQYTGRQACDRCCAESIVFYKENPLVWIDLPEAIEIRRIQEHRNQATELHATVH